MRASKIDAYFRPSLGIFAMVNSIVLCATAPDKPLLALFYTAAKSYLARSFGSVWREGKMIAKLARSLLIHFFACVIYIVANYYGVFLYKVIFGSLTSRGASIGIAMYMIFYLFVFLNLVIAVISKRLFKWCAVVLIVVLILVYLLPLYPVRAIAYSVLAGGLTALAIAVAGKFERFWLSRDLK
ncbi:hypothetical protein [Pseudomonas syringae group genomosp. 3]|nr:hypothetical protein [Pseudomonas syringae group genomosp. 3]